MSAKLTQQDTAPVFETSSSFLLVVVFTGIGKMQTKSANIDSNIHHRALPATLGNLHHANRQRKQPSSNQALFFLHP